MTLLFIRATSLGKVLGEHHVPYCKDIGRFRTFLVNLCNPWSLTHAWHHLIGRSLELSCRTTCCFKCSFVRKAIILSQRIDGADIVIAVLYVQEHGPQALMQCRNAVFVEYFDTGERGICLIRIVCLILLQCLLVYSPTLVLGVTRLKPLAHVGLERQFSTCHVVEIRTRSSFAECIGMPGIGNPLHTHNPFWKNLLILTRQ